MARTHNRLTAVKVASLKRAGYHADGGGLYLRIKPAGTKSWIYRFTITGVTRDCGLGAYPTTSLAMARESAGQCRKLVAAGVDPIMARDQARAADRFKTETGITFKQCAEVYIASKSTGWRNAKHISQWHSTLATYVYPTIGALPIQTVDIELVMKVLMPIWSTKPETASRVRQRIESILSWAKVYGYREGENPALWRGNLEKLLPAKGKIRQVTHHAALPFSEVSAFMTKLRNDTSVSARALELLILTATRTNEVLGATWSEFDIRDATWMIAAKRMKAAREHRVPLTDRALAILREMKTIQQNEYVFPGAKHGRPLSQMSLAMLLRRMGFGHVTVHGFRSSFRDWTAETTNHSRDVAEAALAHTIVNKVEAAYRRGDLFDKRRKLMKDWGAFCAE
jgi:integrase